MGESLINEDIYIYNIMGIYKNIWGDFYANNHSDSTSISRVHGAPYLKLCSKTSTEKPSGNST